MVAKHLHAGLCVWVVGWLEAELCDTQLGEELPQNAHEVAQGEAVICHHTLDLVELSQVRGVQGLIPEYAVDGEVLDRREGFLLGKAIECTGAG